MNSLKATSQEGFVMVEDVVVMFVEFEGFLVGVGKWGSTL